MTRQWWHGFRLPKGGRWRVEMPRLADLVAPPPFLTWRLGGLLGTLCWWLVPRRLIWRLFAVTIRMTLPAAVVSPPGGVGAAGGVIPPWTSTLAVTTPPAGVSKEAWITATIARAKQAGLRYVFVPAALRPYNAALVTFDLAVRMITEGGRADVYDVRAYGAAGDGVTDDTAAIQTAINAATIGPSGTAAVVLCPGSANPYIVRSTLIVNANSITLAGQGYTTTTLKLADGANTDLLRIHSDAAVNYSGIEIRDLLLDGNGANQTAGDVLRISSTWNCRLGPGLAVKRAYRDGIRFSTDGGSGCVQCWLDGVYVEACGQGGTGYGIRFTEIVQQISIRNAIIQWNASGGIFFDTLAGSPALTILGPIEDVYFESKIGGTQAYGVRINIPGIQGDLTLSRCLFNGMTTNAILMEAGSGLRVRDCVSGNTGGANAVVIATGVSLYDLDRNQFDKSVLVGTTAINTTWSTRITDREGMHLSGVNLTESGTTIPARIRGNAGTPAAIEAVLRDESNYASFRALNFRQRDATALIHAEVPLTNGAGAAAGTLSNAPSAGNPSKWIPIDDAGTTRYVPAW